MSLHDELREAEEEREALRDALRSTETDAAKVPGLERGIAQVGLETYSLEKEILKHREQTEAAQARIAELEAAGVDLDANEAQIVALKATLAERGEEAARIRRETEDLAEQSERLEVANSALERQVESLTTITDEVEHLGL